jgi:lysine 2,3-aminomutase
MEITPCVARLMDPEAPLCPLRRQVIPFGAEAVPNRSELADPDGENKDSSGVR